MKYRWIFALAVFAPLIAVAGRAEDECSNVRLDHPGQAFSFIPVYSQTRREAADPGICYAISSAELIDADRFAKDPASLKQLTSPLSVALDYSANRDDVSPVYWSADEVLADPRDERARKLLGLGEIGAAVSASQNQKVCDQRWLQNYVALLGTHNTVSRSKAYLQGPFIGSLTNFLSALVEFAQSNGQDAEALRFFRQRFAATGVDEARLMTAARFIKDPIKLSRAMLEALCADHSFSVRTEPVKKLMGFDDPHYVEANGELRAALGKILNSGGSDFTKAADAMAVMHEFNQHYDPNVKSARLAKKARELLGRADPIPFAIAYCPQVLMGNDQICVPTHGSVVIGRRFNREQRTCEYLVRNSYGPLCKNSVGIPYTVPCDNGSLWVEEKRLFRATMSLEWIPRSPR